jgi:hypothetical protein
LLLPGQSKALVRKQRIVLRDGKVRSLRNLSAPLFSPEFNPQVYRILEITWALYVNGSNFKTPPPKMSS